MVPDTLLHLVLQEVFPPSAAATATAGAAIDKAGEVEDEDNEEEVQEVVLDDAASDRTSRAARAQVRTMPDLAAPSAPRNTS